MINQNTQIDTLVTNKVQKLFNEKAAPRVGIIGQYSPFNNTATVILSSAYSDEVDEILTYVPCPTYMGIQTTAPEPGRSCLVVFKNGMLNQPMVTHFFNQSYLNFDYNRHNYASSGVPQFMIGM